MFDKPKLPEPPKKFNSREYYFIEKIFEKYFHMMEMGVKFDAAAFRNDLRESLDINDQRVKDIILEYGYGKYRRICLEYARVNKCAEFIGFL